VLKGNKKEDIDFDMLLYVRIKECIKPETNPILHYFTHGGYEDGLYRINRDDLELILLRQNPSSLIVPRPTTPVKPIRETPSEVKDEVTELLQRQAQGDGSQNIVLRSVGLGTSPAVDDPQPQGRLPSLKKGSTPGGKRTLKKLRRSYRFF
jgi:hypothetical protein